MKYTVERDVEEWIVVEAKDSEEAHVTANETPIEEWMREVHDERIVEGDLSLGGPWEGPMEPLRRDQM